MPVANSSNITTIQILRSYSNTTPATLEDGQLAYSFVSNTLYIGSNTGIKVVSNTHTDLLSQAAYNQANTATVLADAAYFHANGAFLKANAGYNQANTGTVLAQAAFDKANTGGTITGNVYISSDLSVANTITTNTLNISTNTSNVSFTRGTGITSWNYSGKSFSVASQESNPTGLFISPDGLNMYVNGTTGDDVNQYTLSTAWDIPTATYVRTFSTSSQDSAPNDIFFKPDGLTMFIMGGTNDIVFQYTLSSAWDISTASYASKSFNVSTQESLPTGLWFNPDGTVMYVIGTNTDTVYQYNLGTAWDVSTASYASISFSVTSQETSPQQINLSADGTKMWILGTTNDDINEYNLETAWNVSTATFVNNFYVGFQDAVPQGLFIDSTADDRVYILGSVNDAVFQYNRVTNSINITTDVLTVNNNARIQGNLAVQSSAYVDGSATISGALSVGGSTSLSTTSVGGTFSATSTLNLTGSTTSTTSLGTAATTGTTTIGGTTQTANITFGQSTLTQTTNVAIGNTAAGSTKTIDLGINAGPGSNTRINIGPRHPNANGNVTFNPATTVAIQNTRASTSNTTGALTVLGGVGISGNVYADGVYDGGVEVLSYLQGVDNTQNTRLTVIEATDVSQNVRLDFSNTAITIIQGVDVGQNNRMAISDGVDVSQNVRLDFSNTRMAIIEGVDNSQNVRLDFSNTAITIIQGVDVQQNTRLTVIEGTDLSQNVRLAFSNTRMDINDGVNVTQNTRLTVIEGVDVTQNAFITVIQGVDTSQNSRMTIIEGVNTSQNNRMSIIEGVDVGQNTAIAATDGKMQSAFFHANGAFIKANSAFDVANVQIGVDNTQNTRITVIEGTDVSQNARMTIIEGVDVTQNTNIANKLSLTGAASQTVTGNVVFGNDVTVTGNLVVLGNTISLNVTSIEVEDTLIQLGIGNYTTDALSIGYVGHYNDGTNAHTGFIRDPVTKEFYAFQGYTPEVTGNVININAASFAKANIQGNWFKGNLIATTARVGGLDIGNFATAAYNQANTGTVLAQASFNQANVTVGVDATQNTRLTVIEGTNASQNVRLDFSNTRMTIIDGVDATQNTAIAATDNKMQGAYNVANTADVRSVAAYFHANGAFFKANATFDQANVTIGVDASQNSRMTIIENTDVSQNVRLNFSNTRMDISDGVNASQNVRLDYSNTALTIAQGVDNSQNVRLDYSNTAINQVSSAWIANTVIVANSAGFLSNSVMRFDASNSQLHSMANLSIGTTVASAPLTISKSFTLPTGGEQFGQLNSIAYTVADTGLKQNIRLNTLAAHTSGILNEAISFLNLSTGGGVGGTTTNQYGFWARGDVSAGAAVTNAFNYFSNNSGSLGSPSNQYGFYTANLTKGLLGNYGFYGAVNTGNNAFNLYMAGTAPNYLAGSLTVANNIPSTSNTTGSLVVTGGVGISGVLNVIGAGVVKINNGFVTTGNSGTIVLGDGTFTKTYGSSWSFDGGITTGSVTTTGTGYQSQLGSNTQVSYGVVGVSGTGMYFPNTGVVGFAANSANALFVSAPTSSVNHLQISGAIAGNYPSINAIGPDSSVGIIYVAKNAGLHYFQGAGGTQFAVLPVFNGSASVNYLQASGNSAGNPPVLTAAGTDTNIDTVISSKGTGVINLNTGAGTQVRIIDSGGTAVNRIHLQGQATGFVPIIASRGSDTNLGITYSTQGSGGHDFYTAGTSFTPQFKVAHTASAVNYVQVNGATINNGPTLRFNGSDTNIEGIYAAKGAGSHRFFTNDNNQEQFRVSHTASAVNYIQVTGSAIGLPTVFSTQGSDLSVPIIFFAKGPNGYINFTTENTGNSQFIIIPTSNVVNQLRVTGSTIGTGPRLYSEGSDTNINLLLLPKGNGSANVTSTANSTSNTSGALVVSGGIGVTGNVFLSSANNFTSGGTSYRLGWTDTYLHRDASTNYMRFEGSAFVIQTGTFFNLSSSILRGPIRNDQGNNTVIFAGSSPVLIQNTATSTSNTTGALIVSGGLGLSGNLSMNLASSGAGVNRLTLSPVNFIQAADTTGNIVFSGTGYYYFNAGFLFNQNFLIQRGPISNDQGNNTVIFAGSSPVKIQNGTASSNTTSGALVVQGGVGISGALNATTKSFNIPHPTKEGKNLRYGSLEGPEFGVYVRGTLKGSNVIELPDYWTKLVDANTITVSLTPIGKHQKLSVKEIKDNTIFINSDGWFKKEIHCYYTVFGERADVDKLDVEV